MSRTCMAGLLIATLPLAASAQAQTSNGAPPSGGAWNCMIASPGPASRGSKAHFEALDADGDGRVSRQEYLGCLRDAGLELEAEAEDAFAGIFAEIAGEAETIDYARYERTLRERGAFREPPAPRTAEAAADDERQAEPASAGAGEDYARRMEFDGSDVEVTVVRPEPEVIVRSQEPRVIVRYGDGADAAGAGAGADGQADAGSARQVAQAASGQGGQVAEDRPAPSRQDDNGGSSAPAGRQAGDTGEAGDQRQASDGQASGAQTTARDRPEGAETQRERAADAAPRESDPESPDRQQAAAPEPIPYEAILDADVYNAEGEEVGSVENVLLDPENGRPVLVVSIGGFLGLGDREIVFDWSDVRQEGERIVLDTDLSQERLEGRPEYDEARYEALPPDMRR